MMGMNMILSTPFRSLKYDRTDANEMNFELMAGRTRYLKENPEGVEQMCKVIEDMRKEEREEGMKESTPPLFHVH